MNHVQQTVNDTVGTGNVAHLMIAGEVKIEAPDPQQVMEEMWLRATQVGSVLEGILHEPHGVSRWGLNE